MWKAYVFLWSWEKRERELEKPLAKHWSDWITFCPDAARDLEDRSSLHLKTLTIITSANRFRHIRWRVHRFWGWECGRLWAALIQATAGTQGRKKEFSRRKNLKIRKANVRQWVTTEVLVGNIMKARDEMTGHTHDPRPSEPRQVKKQVNPADSAACVLHLPWVPHSHPHHDVRPSSYSFLPSASSSSLRREVA